MTPSTPYSTVIPPALNGMASLDQWICWKLVHKPGEPKAAKVPTNPATGAHIDPHDPANRMSAEHAQQWAVHAGLGIGFVLTESDPFFFIDLDSCLGDDGQWQPHVYEVLKRFPGAAVEVSCSWRGMHIFGRCAPGLIHSKKCPELRGELYTSLRFVAIGTGATGDANTDHTGALWEFAAIHFPPRAAVLGGEWTTEPREGYTGTFDDAELVQRALRSKPSAATVFGDACTFADLWNADEDALGQAFPGDEMRAFDSSRADLSLAARLSFWTGGNCERIERLMRQSGLQRGKWLDREDYLPRTIKEAVGACTVVYSKPPAVTPELFGIDTPAVIQEVPGIAVVPSFPYCGPEQVLEMFKDYVYVVSVDRAIGPDGMLLDQSRFNAIMRHRVYALDHTNTQTTTNPHKAFMESQCYDFMQARALCFKPGNHEPLIQNEDHVLANTWRDPKPERTIGDPAPFINHLRKLLPCGDDAAIMLAYLSAVVQYQGQKFPWCPLIQGVQGNGKSTLAMILQRAVGQDYVSVLRGSSLTKEFNGWLSKSIVAIIEDLQIGKDRSNILEMFKPMITSTRLQIERKGIDQVTEDICCNFILTSNHQDALPLDRNERRFAMFFCAQQNETDLEAQGMGAEYFDMLHEWLKSGGYAIVSEYLHTYEIPEKYNPATKCMRAPKTTSHEQAIEASRPIEAQIILEAVAAEDPGFRGGWVSSLRASALLDSRRVPTNPRRLVKILEGLGYIWHPSLPRGRTSKVVMQENGRPRLYVVRGHLSVNFNPGQVVDAYGKAQGYAQMSGTLPLGLTSG